ncbi:MAG: hypothetical protein PHS80_11155 [Methanothrix sp.]|nr:hypothetical protein [Methanothrix sp.]MDD4447129.1 hypothetical protein [Methanothrix sp.]
MEKFKYLDTNKALHQKTIHCAQLPLVSLVVGLLMVATVIMKGPNNWGIWHGR